MKNCKIQIINLKITYSRWGQTVQALNNLNLLVPAGQWLFVAGHNGSGKSTLLKMLGGRLCCDKGEVLIDDTNLQDLSHSQLAQLVFYLHQDPTKGTNPTLTLFENLYVADAEAEKTKYSRNYFYDKYYNLLEPIKLTDRMNQLTLNLSGGERQLLSIVIARLRSTPILLLDEPLSALDPVKTDLCLAEIESLHREGRTILHITHNPHLSVTHGNRVIVLRNGQIAYDCFGSERSIDKVLERMI